MIDFNDNKKYVKRLGELTKDSTILSSSTISSINQVFYANDISSSISTASNLSVRYVAADDFHKMVAGDPGYGEWFEPKTLYVISSDKLDAYNTQILNVADPELPTDAANKRYVDAACESVLVIVGDGGGTAELTNYYTKSQTSSASEISNAVDEIESIILSKLESSIVEIGKDADAEDANASPNASNIALKRGVAVGMNATASGESSDHNMQAVAVGAHANASGEAGLAIGSQSIASNVFSIAEGYRSKATGPRSIAIGAAMGGESSSAPGQPEAEGDDSIVIGTVCPLDASTQAITTAKGSGGIAIGAGATEGSSHNDTGGIAIGRIASARGHGSIAIGNGAKTLDQQSIAIGRNASTSSIQANAFGFNSTASARFALALGHAASASTMSSMALGYSANASANGAVQIGAGTNNSPDTLQFYGYTLMDANGKVPLSSLPYEISNALNDTLPSIEDHIDELSNELSSKQDKLSDNEMNEISAVAERMNTIVSYNDGTTSSYHIVGELGSSSIQNGSNATYAKIGSTVTSIAYGSFYGFNALSAIDIPENVTSIGTGAFIECSSLQYVKIAGYGATTIGDSAFDACQSLTSIDIGDGIASIGRSTFNGCISLKNVTFGKNVSTIGNDAFYNCSNLSSIVFVGRTIDELPANAPWGAIDAKIETYNPASQEWVDEKLSTSTFFKNDASNEVSGSTTFINDVSISGTFSLSSNDSLSGFYINNDNFVQCVLSAVLMMNDNQIAQLNEKLGIASTNNQAQLDM